MKRLTDVIKGQIQRIPISDLKNLLLSHFNEDAHDLTELFCKQFPANKNQLTLNTPVTIRLPVSLSVLAIVFTYAPNELRQDLLDSCTGLYTPVLRSVSPRTYPTTVNLERSLLEHLPKLDLISETDAIAYDELAERCLKQLNYYSDARPIIMALKKQGANDLIQVLEEADERSLSAFSYLAKDTDLQILTETFLVKNSHDLELVNRNHLIQFLRQPDLSGWLTRFLDSLVYESADALSIRLVLWIFSPYENEVDRLKELRACLAQYPFSIHLQAMRALFDFYQYELKRDVFSPTSHLVMLLLNDLLKSSELAIQVEFLKGLSQETLLLIVEYCLEHDKKDGQEKPIWNNLLTLLCSEFCASNQECLKKIRIRLNQLDPCLFDTPELHQLALDLLAKFNSVEGKEPTISSSIARLLSSPQFVEACPPKGVRKLIERWGLFTLTLSQVEYSQESLFKDYSPCFDEINEHMTRIDFNLLHHPEGKSFWLDKKYKLLQFRVRSSESALFHQLENVLEKQEKGSDFNKGLDVIYHYYSLTCPNLRSDLFLRAINQAYSRFFVEGVTDNEPRGALLQWLNHDSHRIDGLPKELYRDKEIFLYNSAGQRIGFLNESNTAMTFVEEEIVLLAQTGSVDINEPLYDKEGQVIGYLTEASHLRSESEFQKKSGALVLGELPKNDLENSSFGLELLLRNVLFENSIKELYHCESIRTDTNKLLWLNNKLLKEIQETSREIPASILSSLLDNFDDEAIFELLGSIKYKPNAIHLFHYILNRDTKRAILFNGFYESDFQKFLAQHDAEVCLADYLVNYHDKAWFSECLLRFAYYGKKHKKDNLLSNALTLIINDAGQDKKQEAICDAVLASLICSEPCAALVLKEFLNDKTQNSVQKVNQPEIAKVTQFFKKRHLIALITQLNKTSYWEQNAQYKLALHILAHQHGRFFLENDFSPGYAQPWQGSELKELARFISRHLSKKRPLDNKHDIGYSVLGELVFRCANLEITSLFYMRKTFNRAIAQLSFAKHFLLRLVDKLWMPKGIRELYVHSLLHKSSWFDNPAFLQKALKDHRALLDWSHFIKQTWNKKDKRKSPIICPYLLSYSGKKTVLLQLLQDYFNSFQKMPAYIQPVSKLLRLFPQREVSGVIYDALESAILKEPQLLDKQILSDMAFYYDKQFAKRDISYPQAELNLLVYWGQNKYYSLAQKGCELLIKDCEDKRLKKLLTKVANEASVEQDLSSSLGTFYFGLIKLFKRLWHYGFNAERNSSKIIKFCDDLTPGPTRKQAEDLIKVPTPSEAASSDYWGFSEKRKQLIKLLATIKRSPAHFTRAANYSDSTRTFFSEQPNHSTNPINPVISSSVGCAN